MDPLRMAVVGLKGIGDTHLKAIDRLESLLKIPYRLSPGWLRIDPAFDPLRKNPRFERLVKGVPRNRAIDVFARAFGWLPDAIASGVPAASSLFGTVAGAKADFSAGDLHGAGPN